MSHFEEILKMIGLMKVFSIKCDAHVTQQTGNVTSSVIASCQPHPPSQVTFQHCRHLKILGPCCMHPAPN